MITPFKNGQIDWPMVDALVEWFVSQGVAGIFAVCLSSEMYHLTPEERLKLAKVIFLHRLQRHSRLRPVSILLSALRGEFRLSQLVPLGAVCKSRRILSSRCTRWPLSLFFLPYGTQTGVQAVVVVANQLCKQEEVRASYAPDLSLPAPE